MPPCKAEFIGGEMDGTLIVIPDCYSVYRFAKLRPLDPWASSSVPLNLPPTETVEYFYWQKKGDRTLYVLDHLKGFSLWR